MANGKIIAPGNGAAVINLNQSIQMFGSERTQVNITEVDVYPDIEGEVLESKDSHQIPEQEKYMRECAFAAAMVNLQKNMQKESLLSLHAKAGVIQTITLPDKFIAVTTGNGFYTENEPILKSKNIEYENELCAPCSAPAIEQLKKLMAADEVKLKETYNEEELEELFDAYWDSGKFGGNWWYDEDTLAEAIYMLTLEITCLGDINLIEQTQKTEQKCNKKAEEEQQKRKQAIESYGTPIENPVWSGAYGMSGRFLPDNRMILLQYLANASKNGYYNEDMLAQLENNLGVVGIDFSTKNYTIDEECMYGLIERYMQYPESNKVIGKFLDNGGGLIVMGVLTLGVGCLASMKPQTGRASKNAEALEKEVEAEAEVKVEEKVAAESEGVSESGTDTVTYRRVQGGAGNQSSQQRVVIDSEGNVYINKKDRNLNISIDNGEHSQYYINNNRPGADIYEFEVPKWLDDMVKEYTIPQAGYKNNPLNQGGSAPKLTDPTTPGTCIEFPAPWIEWIEEYATKGRIISGGQ